MSTAATMQQTPAVPPRPSRGQEKPTTSSPPTVPPRPSKRDMARSVSPGNRFAPSPLNEGFGKVPGSHRLSIGGSGLALPSDPIDRAGSVDLPSIGQEGQEYAAMADGLGTATEEQQVSSPEQTRTVGEDVQLHAPKPTVPAQSAEQRVAKVTRTDSDKAASFGIGKPNSEDPYPRSLKKKASTTSQLSHDSHFDDEHGIPEIGQRVPMLLNAGDVQAPSPTPDSVNKGGKHHTRKVSGRSVFGGLPSDAYGLHGHGFEAADKLEKAYYEKHPEVQKREIYNPYHDRPTDYSMSSDDLNKIVKDTASRSGGATGGYTGTPSEQVGYQASEEYTSRMSSPRPPSTQPRQSEAHVASPLKRTSFSQGDLDDDVIHVDEPGFRKGFLKSGNDKLAPGEGVADEYDAPILASDELVRIPSNVDHQPAIEPSHDLYDPDRPRSRPTSRPASIYSGNVPEIASTPLDDVEEYEPLFPDDPTGEKKLKHRNAQLKELHHRFPSRDIWEDAPNSVHATAEVSTPEPTEGARKKPDVNASDLDVREGETPAQAFARRQEELAESEDRNPDVVAARTSRSRPPAWAEHQPHLAKEMHARPGSSHRFPSRDVWEDTPDSLQLHATVSSPQQSGKDTEPSAEIAAANKPSIPQRPTKKTSGDDKPVVPERPKPQVPARPAKTSSEAKDADAAPRQKPAVPARPVGGKIAALQAGFMSDLNKRLQLGPQAPKKEEPKSDDAEEETEKAPLADARKGRARGPQRRAPTKTAGATGPPSSSEGKPVLSFSMTRTLWCIDEEGTMQVEREKAADLASHEKTKTAENPLVQEVEVPVDHTEAGPDADEDEPETAEATEIPLETKTLATNTAGESILEETISKKPVSDEVEDLKETKDEVLSA